LRSDPITVNKKVIEEEIFFQNTLVLHYKIEYPYFESLYYKKVLEALNHHYKAKALKKQQDFEQNMYWNAVNHYKEALSNQFPFHMHEAQVAYQVTYNENCVISLYFDTYRFTGGAHGTTIRNSDTWELERGRTANLYDFIPNQEFAVDMINKQIATQISHDEDWYFENYTALVEKSFNPQSFYLHPAGVALY
jgi:hypothetical protein